MEPRDTLHPLFEKHNKLQLDEENTWSELPHLSNKLKSLKQYDYIERTVKTEPPLRVERKLTAKGKNTVLLALPLLYYSSSTVSTEKPKT